MQNVRASDDRSHRLEVRKLDKQTWQLHSSGEVTVEYSIFWDDPGPFSTQLNANHAFINLATVLFYVPARRTEAARIAFTGLREGWSAAAALRNADYVWTPAKLQQWLASPHNVVPETEMTFPGLKSEQERIDVVEFLEKRDQKK